MTEQAVETAPERVEETVPVPKTDAVVLGLVTFVVYVIGASRTIFVGDSGELVAASHTLGVAHPPGYPLYLILGKVWSTLLPIGSVAFRMSLFSATCAAIAIGLLSHALRRLGVSRVAAAAATLLFAFSPSFWGEANIQRVYALGAVFVCVLLHKTISWWKTREEHHLVAAWFICGLGATNHQYMLFAAVALAAFVLIEDRRYWAKTSNFLRAGAFGAFGLLPYLYLPIRARMNPPVNFGQPGNFRSFLFTVSRTGFWDRVWVKSVGDVFVVVGDYLEGLGREMLWVGLAAGLVAFVVWTRRRQRFVLFLALMMVVNLLALTIHGSRADIFIWHRYYIPTYLMAAVLAGLGFDLLVRWWRPAAVLVLAVPIVALAIGYRSFDRSRFRVAEDFSSRVLDQVPKNGQLFANDDNILFVLMYLLDVERVRPDVNLVAPEITGDFRTLKFNPDRDPVRFTHNPNWRVPTLRIVPVGLVFQPIKLKRPMPKPDIPTKPLAGEYDERVPKDYLTQNLIGHYHYMIGISQANRDWPAVLAHFAAAAKAAPDNDVQFYNMGLIYAQYGLLPQSLEAFTRSYQINPRPLQSASRPRASDRIYDVRSEMARLAPIEARLAKPISRKDFVKFQRRLASKLEKIDEDRAAYAHRVLADLAEAAKRSRR